MSLGEIAKRIEKCKACPLYKTCTKKVPGEGPKDARVFLVGEAPGRVEDETGRPFVGAAGKFLNELLLSAGLSRERVFIGNLVKCRPPGNRDPTEEEINACAHFLDEQLSVVRPRVIVTLGRFSSEYIFQKYGLKWGKISDMHGKVFNIHTLFGLLLIIPMYHPAAGLYHGETKKKIEEDWAALKELLSNGKVI